MRTTIECLNIDEALEKMIQIKNEKKNGKKVNVNVVICTIDYDNDTEDRKIATPDEGCVLIRKSKTRIFNDDDFFPHMELYSKVIKNISDLNSRKREGIVHDIIWCGG